MLDAFEREWKEGSHLPEMLKGRDARQGAFCFGLNQVDVSQRTRGGEYEGQDAKVAFKSTRGRTYLIARQVGESDTEDPQVRRNAKDERGGSKP